MFFQLTLNGNRHSGLNGLHDMGTALHVLHEGTGQVHCPRLDAPGWIQQNQWCLSTVKPLFKNLLQ